jgi:chromosome segregation ATPase
LIIPLSQALPIKILALVHQGLFCSRDVDGRTIIDMHVIEVFLLNHLSTEIVINSGCVDVKGESIEEKRAFLIEIDELKMWKVNASEELDAKNHEVETLKQIALFKEQIKVLERENASILSRLEPKSGCYKVLKLADLKIAEACDERSALIKESQASNDLMSTQMSEHEEKLKVARDIIAKVRSENASLEETLRCKAVEVHHLHQRLLNASDEDTDAKDSGDMSSEVSVLRQRKLDAQETMDVTNKEMETLLSVNQELRIKQQELVEQLQSTNEAECKRLHADNRKCAKEVEINKLALAEAVNKSSSLQISLATKSSQYDKLQQELLVKVTEYESTITELKVNALEEAAAHIDTTTRLETDLASATSTISELMIQAENQATKITTLENELHAAEKDLADAVGDVDQLERFVSEVRENLLLKDTELNQTKAECERLSSEIKIYQDKCDQWEDYIFVAC